MRDAILLSDFLPATQAGFRQFCLDVHGTDEMLQSGQPESWAWFWFQLNAADDKPEWFPCGKWATLQRLGQLLHECARNIGKAGACR